MEPELAAERTALALALMAAPLLRSKWIDLGAESTRHCSFNDDSLEDRGLSRLPPEIWLQMLPKTTIRNITTTCRLFGEIAQPLLFRRLIFQPFVSIFNVFNPTVSSCMVNDHIWYSTKISPKKGSNLSYPARGSPPRFAAWGSFQLMTEVTAETWKIVMLFSS